MTCLRGLSELTWMRQPTRPGWNLEPSCQDPCTPVMTVRIVHPHRDVQGGLRPPPRLARERRRRCLPDVAKPPARRVPTAPGTDTPAGSGAPHPCPACPPGS